MRITVEEKNATRKRIVDVAIDLFRSQGFENATTRDIAQGAGIAVGTLFNYFQTKEAIVHDLAEEALTRAHADWRSRQAFNEELNQSTLEETLFGLIAAELRQLKPLRKFIAPFLETALSPLIAAKSGEDEGFRVSHLELVAESARRCHVPEPAPVSLQMYWALYTGVLAFWAIDKSPRQEETLALLDESIHMLTNWLFCRNAATPQERN